MDENCIVLVSKNKLGRKKGCVPWNKGIPRTDEEKIKIGLKQKGIIRKGALENLKKGRGWNKGKKMSPEFCNKISIATKGRVAWNKKEPTKCKCGKILSRHYFTKCQECHHKELKVLMKGIIFSQEHKDNLSLARRNSILTLRGDKHLSWKGGVTSINEKIRKSFEYKQWRQLVFKRDYWTCQICHKKIGIIINAHHIKEFNLFPELRFDVGNGITLCLKCHKIIHSKEIIKND